MNIRVYFPVYKSRQFSTRILFLSYWNNFDERDAYVDRTMYPSTLFFFSLYHCSNTKHTFI